MTYVLIAATVVVHALVCLLAADFLAGLVHWAEDTWLRPGVSPLLDRLIVAPNMEHHQRPGGIRLATYWENNWITMAIVAVPALIVAACGVTAWEPYLTLLIASQSNQIHMWGHCSNPPRPVRWLQRCGLLQPAAHHALHHKRPYGMRYCTTTVFLNPLLDGLGFWRGLERIGEMFGAHVYRATPIRGGY
ncbi:MAG TPA: fatty acid desaturase CarF family protein [Candidatus Elarobacter sp.]|jgi:ubiquitin-conjugating enzyme E2 variant|nr:fatty acid desaturase CarF family protein [Candidatus Elarobacter sp.]